MRMRPFAAWLAGMVFAAAVAAPAAAPVASQSSTTGTLPHGGSYIISADSAIGATAMDLWFRAPGPGYGDALPGLARLAATAAAAAPLESGKSLVSLVRAAGGRLTISAYPDLIGVGIVVPAPSAGRILAAMTSAYFAPSIGEDAFKTAQRDMAVLGVQKRYSVDQVLHDDVFSAIFSGGPAHYPTVPNAISDVTKMTLADVTTFAKQAFRSSNATITLAGNVSPAAVDAITAGTAGSSAQPVDSAVASTPLTPVTDVALVAGTGIGWVGPAIADERSATAMDFIADYLFRDETGVLNAATDAPEDDVSGQFITLHDPGVMLVTLGSGKDLTKRVLDAIVRMQQPMGAAAFAAAREAFLYHLAADTQLPQEQADNLGWYAAEGNAAYAPSNLGSAYWSAARSLDAQFVASVARKYLSHPIIVQLQKAPASAKESAS